MGFEITICCRRAAIVTAQGPWFISLRGLFAYHAEHRIDKSAAHTADLSYEYNQARAAATAAHRRCLKINSADLESASRHGVLYCTQAVEAFLLPQQPQASTPHRTLICNAPVISL